MTVDSKPSHKYIPEKKLHNLSFFIPTPYSDFQKGHRNKRVGYKSGKDHGQKKRGLLVLMYYHWKKESPEGQTDHYPKKKYPEGKKGHRRIKEEYQAR